MNAKPSADKPVRIPVPLHREVKKIARSRGFTLRGLLTVLLSKWVEEQKAM